MFRHRRSAKDFADEVQTHLQLEADELEAEGLSREEAHRRARVAFGNVVAAQEYFHLKGRVLWFDNLVHDLKFALRQLARNPGFAVVAVVTLALGIGVNTAMFSVANGLLFSSLHIEQQSRVQQIGFRLRGQDWEPRLSLPESQELTASTKQVFSEVFGGQYGLDGLSMEGSKPDRVFTEYVTGNYFQALGVKPLLGRFFRPSEGVTPGADPYIVLSYSYWKQHFAADPDIVGRKIAVDSVPITVIGVAPRDYRGLVSILQVQAYLPLAMVVPIALQVLPKRNPFRLSVTVQRKLILSVASPMNTCISSVCCISVSSH